MNDSYDIIIPACNEESTVGDVVRAAKTARGVASVFVVDDHSGDSTAQVAAEAGAVVILSQGTRSKAQALATGVAASTAPVLVFFDADILNCQPLHFEALVEPVLAGRSVLSLGLVDYGSVRNRLFLRLPPITGLRALRREIFEAIPEERRNGFQIEIMINEVVARGGLKSTIRVLSDCDHRSKVAKVGFRRGAAKHAAMTVELLSCFRFVPLWTYRSYLKNLTVLAPTSSLLPGSGLGPLGSPTKIAGEIGG